MRIHWSNQRGAALAGVVLSITAFFALTAVAVDIGRTAFVANEVQNAADIAATSGAMALVQKGPGYATDDAMAAVSPPTLNLINGTRADQAAQWTIEEGTFSNGTFTVQNPPNAVRATAVSTVQNIVAGVFSSSDLNTTITKVAIAAFTTIGSGDPTLPLMIGECKFENFNCTEGNCPPLFRAPAQDNNSGWTDFAADSSVNGNSVGAFLPAPCGGGGTPPEISVGDTLQGNGGSIPNILEDIKQCLFCGTPRVREFLVPVVDCSTNFNGPHTVTGFATLEIESFHYPSGGPDGTDSSDCGVGGPQPDGINLRALRRVDEPGGQAGGCPACGTGTIKLVS